MKKRPLKRDGLILAILIVIAVIMQFLHHDAKPSLKLQLSSRQSICTAGDSIRLFATLTNCSDSSVVMVLPQPGSAQSMRFPYCTLRITDPEGNLLEMPRTSSILPPPLQLQHIITIAPGDSLQLYPLGLQIPCSFMDAGTYRVSMLYRTDSRHERLWHGPYTHNEWVERNKQEFWQSRQQEIKKVGRLLNKVPPVQLYSEPLEITVI